MYARDDKRRLYELISMYLSETISATKFCDEFYYCFDLELDHSTLTLLETQAFTNLDEVCSRFSQYEEDYKLDSKAFATETELHGKVEEVGIRLGCSFLR